MRETPAGLTLRTSIAYAPPPCVTLLARPLAPDEPCPTLFRYVGPCGIADWFAGALARLAPRDLLWMSARTTFADSFGARYFGTMAVLQPLRFHAAAAGDGLYIGAARALDPDEAVVWLPPSLLDARLPWDRLASAADARTLVAPAPGERAAVIESLARYLEELDAMRRSGAPGPGVAWCRVSDEERRRRLAAAGVRGVWTAWVSPGMLAAS